MAAREAKRRRIDVQEDEMVQIRLVDEASSKEFVNPGATLQPGPSTIHNSQYGLIKADGNSQVHNGDAVHHHYYGSTEKDRGQGAEEQAFDALRESLTFERMDARLRNISTALPQTCRWLYKHKHFVSWNEHRDTQRHGGFLWIKGKPGSGKSTIMKAAFNWSIKNLPKDFVTVSYFFNARAPDTLEKSSFGLYRSVLHQVLNLVPSLKDDFLFAFGSKYKSSTGSVETWTEHEIRDFLITITQDTKRPPLCVFVDALDEGAEEDVRNMISFLEELSMHADECGTVFRICFSSRHYPHITIRNGLSLIVEDQSEHNVDIEKYVKKKLVSIRHVQWDELRAEICRKAAGIFLWVVLVVPMLNTVHDHGGLFDEIMGRLENIPEGLEGLFAEILQQTPEETPLSISLLQWVLFSTRPLSPTELYLAVQYTKSVKPINIVIPDESSVARSILTISHGLVEETKAQPPKLQFIHESVREFLLGPKGIVSIDPSLRNDVSALSHYKLYVASRQYVESLASGVSLAYPKDLGSYYAKTPLDLQLEEHPFFAYATTNLFHHAETAAAQVLPKEHTFHKFTGWDQFGIWERLRNHYEKYEVRKYDNNVTMCYFLAEQGYVHLLGAYSDMQGDINHCCGRYGTALQAASFAGHTEVVKLLIKHGADVNIENGEHGHPLAAAIRGQHLDIAQLLYEYGARLNRTLLQRTFMKCITRGSGEAVKLLLELGADPYWKNSSSESIVYMAAKRGLVKLLRFLVDSGVLATSESEDLEKALYISAECGHDVVVDILVANGAKNLDQALWKATKFFKHTVINRLLASGASMSSKISRQCFDRSHEVDILQFAAHTGQIDAVRTILRHKKISWVTYEVPPLLLAASEGHREIVNLLMDNGADIHATRPDHPKETAIAVAVGRGHADVIEVLLNNGASISRSEASAALHPAVDRCNLNLVKRLFAAGAEPDQDSIIAGTMLSPAIRHGGSGLVILQLLLKKGVVPNKFHLRIAIEKHNVEAFNLMKCYMVDVGGASNACDEGGQHEANHHVDPPLMLTPIRR